ncbi:MAG: beta-ketoacyl synthase N-terminal-like domain-containing protein [Verrucomicrobiota bacterium]
MSVAESTIVVTGSGLVCGAGETVAGVCDQLLSGDSSVRPYESWPSENWPVKFGAEVTTDNRTLVPERKLHKTISKSDLFGIYAAERAIDGSGWKSWRDGLDESEQPAFNDQTGIIAGSGGGSFHSNYDYLPLIESAEGELQRFGAELSEQVTPMWLLKNLPNNVLCHVGIRAQFKGTNACITNHCASGPLAVGEGVAAIRNGEASRIVAVAHDAPFEPENLLYYYQLGLATDGIPRPFDRSRSGTALGEGAAAVALETEQSAASRGAEVLGKILGFACVGEATGVFELDEEGSGVNRAITMALADADLSPDGIDLIVAHGNGTPASDKTEALGIREAFGSSEIPPVTAFKWAFGHMIAASGMADLALTLELLKRGEVPAVPNFEAPDPEFADFPIATRSGSHQIKTALLICRGFGGVNTALIVGLPTQ